MAIDPGCNAKIEYTGDGVQTDFTYPFPTIEDTDLYVAVWDDETEEYNNVTNWTKDGGLVRFDTAPDAGQKFVIYRMTDIDPMKAIFHPGHPVKAGDLNNNFEQLQYAIEDVRCFSSSGSPGGSSGGGGGGSGESINIVATAPLVSSLSTATNTYTLSFNMNTLNFLT